MEEGLTEVKDRGRKVKKDLKKAQNEVREDVKDSVKQKKDSNLKFGIFGLRSKIYLCSDCVYDRGGYCFLSVCRGWTE